MFCLYLLAEETGPEPDHISSEVDVSTKAALAEAAIDTSAKPVAQKSVEAAPAKDTRDAVTAADAAPAEPADDASETVDAPPAEPVNDAPETVDVPPAEPVNDPPAAADAPPVEPVNDPPAAVDTPPAEPANDAPEAVDAPPAEPVNDPPAAADAPPAEPVNDPPAAVDAPPAEPVNDASTAAEHARSTEPEKDYVSDPDTAEASNVPDTDTAEVSNVPDAPRIQADQAKPAEAVLQAQEDTASETYSIILRNQVYGDADNAQARDLSARLTLRIYDTASLPVCPEDWSDDSGSYFRELVIKNMESQTIPGIPFSCPVWVEEPTLIYEDNSEVQPVLINEGNASTVPYSRSAIVNGSYQDISSSPDYELNADGNQRGDCEYTLMWTANRDGEKPLYIINDSDTALSLSIDTESSSVVYVPGEAEQDSSGSGSGQNESGSGSGQDSGGSSTGAIVIPAKSWGSLTITTGDTSGASGTGNNPAGGVMLTPLNAVVERVIPSVGSADSEGTWMLGQDTVADGSYVVYRVKPIKTGDDDKEKTGDDKPDEGTPDDIPDSPNPPEPSEPEGKDITPDQPGNPDHSPEDGKEPQGGKDLPQKPENVPASEESGKKPSKPAGHSSRDSVKKTSQPDSSTGTRAFAGDGTPAVNASSVDTADHTPVELYAVLMLIAGAVAAVLLLTKKIQG